ncbi:MAG: FMN-binding protein [Arenicellales bacterium]
MQKSINNRRTLSIDIVLFIAAILALPAWSAGIKEAVYYSNDEFLRQAFNSGIPEVRIVWLKGTLKTDVSKALGHDYPALRVRYWLKDHRSAWILDEVGRDKPITTGFIIQDHQLVSVKVLVFRESRGDEIRFPSFTGQFSGVALNNKHQLNHRIDGISGATLSVNAVRKLAAVALLLSDHVMKKQDKR